MKHKASKQTQGAPGRFSRTLHFLVQFLMAGNPPGRMSWAILHLADSLLTLMFLGLIPFRIWNSYFEWAMKRAVEIQEKLNDIVSGG